MPPVSSSASQKETDQFAQEKEGGPLYQNVILFPQ